MQATYPRGMTIAEAERFGAHNRGQRKRLRKELHKLVDAL